MGTAMTMAWEPPRCGHGAILLGCPHDDCAEQNDYVAGQRAAIERYEAAQQQAARAYVRQLLGLPSES